MMDRQSIESRRAGTARRRVRRDAVTPPPGGLSPGGETMPPAPAEPHPVSPEPPTVRRMTRPRMLLAYGILAGIALGHGYEIVTGHEHWPFTHYGMFSSIAGPTAEDYHLVGIPLAEGDREVPIRPEYFPA